MSRYGVFVSYSHEDSLNVTPIVNIIRAVRKDLVFQDLYQIKPGKLWEPQLMKALTESRLLILFWCEHASNSPEVKKEYELALQQNKDILPILLDSTILDERLQGYQWIDVKDLI